MPLIFFLDASVFETDEEANDKKTVVTTENVSLRRKQGTWIYYCLFWPVAFISTNDEQATNTITTLYCVFML